MKEFVYGTEIKYAILKESLNDHLCHVFRNCIFPNSFSVETGRIGFEKEGETYVLYIDRGITCSNSQATELLQDWLSSGTLRFLDYNDVKEFLRSLKILYR